VALVIKGNNTNRFFSWVLVRVYENKIYLKNLSTESEIIKFSDLYRILGVVIQIRMIIKKVNFMLISRMKKQRRGTAGCLWYGNWL